MQKVIISAKVDKEINVVLSEYARELQLSKSWIIQQALEQYFLRYDEYLSDMRIASLSKGVPHEEILKEYGVSDKVG